MVKNLPAMLETWVQPLGRENPLEKEMATHSSILAWRIPWTEEPGRLQSIRLQPVRHDGNNIACTHTVHIYVNANLQIHPTGCFLARCLYVYSLCLWQLTFELRTRASDVGKHLPGPEQCQSWEQMFSVRGEVSVWTPDPEDKIHLGDADCLLTSCLCEWYAGPAELRAGTLLLSLNGK